MIRRPRGGFAAVATASAVAGLVGYGITIVAARLLGVEYGEFGVFWSALYFGVGALTGAQQEFARMTRAASGGDDAPGSGAVGLRRSIGLAVVASVAIAGAATMVLAVTALQGDPLLHVLALGAGFACFGLYAVLLGMLYGARRWRLVAIATIADPLLRMIAIVAVVGSGGGLTGAVWATVAPFAVLTLALLIAVLPGRSLVLDRAPGRAIAAAGVVVAGGVASSFLINGIPALFALIAAAEEPAVVSRYVFAFILVRAPLVVGALALQSFLVVHLRDHPRPWRFTGSVVAAIAGVTALGVVVLALVGRWLIELIGGGLSSPDTSVLVGIVIASGTTSIMIVLGCLALALERRRLYAVSWWVAAVTVVLLAVSLPGEAEARITIASALAPALGAVALAAGLRSRA